MDLREENQPTPAPEAESAPEAAPAAAEANAMAEDKTNMPISKPMVLTIVGVVLVLVVALLYVWSTNLAGVAEAPTLPPADTAMEDEAMEEGRINDGAAPTPAQDDTVTAIEADLDQTELDDLDAELDQMEAELDAALAQ